MADMEMAEPRAPTPDALPAAPGRRVVPERVIKRERIKVDRGEGIARLTFALVLILAGGGYAVYQSVQAEKNPAKPTVLQVHSQRERGFPGN